MTELKKKKVAGYAFTIIMVLAVIIGIIVFFITHLDDGVIYKYSKKDSERIITEFLTALQSGDSKALDYVWYHKDSSKMLKELMDYDNSESETAVADAQDAYTGLKQLLVDEEGSKLIKTLFEASDVSESKSKSLKVRKHSFITDETIVSYKDYGHTALYYMYESTVDAEHTQFDSIKSFNMLFESIKDVTPKSETGDAFYLVPTSSGLKIDAYLFLKSLGISDIIYTGRDSIGNVSCASVGNISIATEYTTSSDYDESSNTNQALMQLMTYVEQQDIEGLYSYVAELIGETDKQVTGQLGDLLACYNELDETARTTFSEKLSAYEKPLCLRLKNSTGFSGYACLLKLKNSYSEPIVFIDSESIGDDTIKLLNCVAGIYDQFREVLTDMGALSGEGAVSGSNNKTEVEIDSDEDDYDDDAFEEDATEETTTEGVTTSNGDDIVGDRVSDDSDTNGVEDESDNSSDKSDSKSNTNNASNSETRSDSSDTSSKITSYYTKEELQTIQENNYENEEEFEYREGDGTFGGEDEDPAFTEDYAD